MVGKSAALTRQSREEPILFNQSYYKDATCFGKLKKALTCNGRFELGSVWVSLPPHTVAIRMRSINWIIRGGMRGCQFLKKLF